MASEVWPGLPDGLFSGMRAMTSQSFIEANVKNGRVFEASSAPVSLAAAGNLDIILITGNTPVIVKDRKIKFNGVLLTTRIFRAPTYTGGSLLTAYNLNDTSSAVSSVQILGGVAVSATGTEFGAPTYEIGSSGLGSSQLSTFSTPGTERILRPNTVYLQRTTNGDATPYLVSGALIWYEGPIDLPLTGPLP